jgi:hypothetical protein
MEEGESGAAKGDHRCWNSTTPGKAKGDEDFQKSVTCLRWQVVSDDDMVHPLST